MKYSKVVYFSKSLQILLGFYFLENASEYKYVFNLIWIRWNYHSHLRKFLRHFRVDIVSAPFWLEFRKRDNKMQGITFCFIRLVWFMSDRIHTLEA